MTILLYATYMVKKELFEHFLFFVQNKNIFRMMFFILDPNMVFIGVAVEEI